MVTQRRACNEREGAGKLKYFIFVGCLLGPSLAGCASGEFVGRPDLTYRPGEILPEPTREDLTVPARPYVIGPSDELLIDVFGVPEATRELTVDLSGQIALPLAGPITASGMTPQELSDAIRQRLIAAHVRDPQVVVNIKTAANQAITVDGAVTTPGIYPVVGRMTLMRAVARASGTTEFAKENHVVVFRRAQGKDYATLYDLRAIRQGMYADPEIFSNDVIVVGESQARRIFKDVLAASPLITTPIIYLLR